MSPLSEIFHDNIRQILLLLIQAQEHSIYSRFIFVAISAFLVMIPIIIYFILHFLLRAIFSRNIKKELPKQRKSVSFAPPQRRDSKVFLVEALKMDISVLSDANESTANELLEILSKLQEVQADSSCLKDKIQSLEVTKVDLEMSGARRLQQISDLETELNQLKLQNSSYTDFKDDISILENECKVLKKQVEDLENVKVATETKIVLAEQETTTSHTTINSLQGQLSQLKADFDQLSMNHAESEKTFKTELESYHNVVSELQSKLTVNQEQLTAAQLRIIELEKAMHILRVEYESSKSIFEAENTQLRNLLEDQNRQLIAVTDTKNNLDQYILSLKRDAEASSSKINILKAELAKQVSYYKRSVQEQLAEVSTSKLALENQKLLSMDIQELLSMNIKANADIDRLKVDLAHCQEENNELVSLQQRDKLCHEEAMERLRLSLESQHATELTSYIHDFDTANAALTVKIDSLESTVESLGSDLVVSREGRESLRLQRESQAKLLECKEAETQRLTEEVESTLAAKLVLEERERLLTVQVATLEEECKDVSERILELSCELAVLRSELGTVNDNCTQLKAEYELRVAALQAATDSLLTEQSRFEESQLSVFMLESTVSALEEQSNAEVTALEEIKAALEHELSTTRQELDTVKESVLALEVRLATVQEEAAHTAAQLLVREDEASQLLRVREEGERRAEELAAAQREAGRLRDSVAALQLRENTLQDQLQSVSLEYDTAVAAVNEEKKALSEKNAELSVEVTHANDNYSQLKTEYDLKATALQAATDSLLTEQSRLEESQQRVSMLESAVTSLEAQNAGLSAELAAAREGQHRDRRASVDALSSLQLGHVSLAAEVTVLLQSKTALERELETCKKELEAKANELAGTLLRCNNLQTEFDSVSQAKEEVQSKYESVLGELKASEDRVISLNCDMLAAEERYEHTNGSYIEEISELERQLRQLSEHQEQLSSLTQLYEHATAKLSTTSNSIVELEMTISSLSNKHHEEMAAIDLKYEATVKENQATSNTLFDLRTSLDKVSANKLASEAQYSSIVKELESSTRYASTLQDEIKVLMETNTVEVTQRERTIQELKTNLAKYSALVVVTNLSRDELDVKYKSVLTDMSELQRSIKSLEAEKANILVTSSMTTEVLASKVASLEDLRASKLTSESALERLRLEISNVKEENSNLNIELVKQVNITSENNHEISRLLAAIEALKTDEMRLLDENKENVMQIENIQSTSQQQLAESEQLRLSLQSLLDQQIVATTTALENVTILQNKLDDTSTQMKHLEAELQEEAARGDSQRQALQSDLSLAENKIAQLLKSIDGLSAEKALLARDGLEMLQLRRIVAEHQEALNEVKIENNALESELAKQAAMYKLTIMDLKEKTKVYQNDIEGLKKEIILVNDMVNSTDKENDELRLRLAEVVQSKAMTEEVFAVVKAEANNLNSALAVLLNKHTQSVNSQLKDITLSELERKSLQSLLDEVLQYAQSGHSADVAENMQLITAYIELLSKELYSLKYQIKNNESSTTSAITTSTMTEEPIKERDIIGESRLAVYEQQVTELKSAVDNLENDLQAAKLHANTLLSELSELMGRYEATAEELTTCQDELYKSSEELLRTTTELRKIKDVLLAVQSENSRLMANAVLAESNKNVIIPSSASLSSSKDFTAYGSLLHLKEFPIITANPELKSEATAELSNMVAISPLSMSNSIVKSPNKMQRRLRAIEDKESEITLPYSSKSVIDDILHSSSNNNKPESPETTAGSAGHTESLSSATNPSIRSNTAFPINLLASIIKPKTKMMVMCDMSATMANGGRIKAQRKCVYSISNASIENNSCLAIGCWNSTLHWVDDGMTLPGWRKGEEILSSFKALDAVTPEGGHDMRNSLEAAIRALPDVTDIVVLCHGITWPFEPLAVSTSTHIVTNWMAFRRRYQYVKFHFVALGSSADRKGLQRMAKDGDGCFVIISNPR